VQEVSTVLWEKFDQYDRSRPFSHWALGFARLQAVKWRSRRQRRGDLLTVGTLELLAGDAAGEAEALHALRDRLVGCLAEIGDQARRVVDLRYQQALPLAAVADVLGKSVPAVEMMLVRIRRILRTCLERKEVPA
jgi:RNA polymerase sigma-70 factor (ECF subfamily)